MIRSYAVVPTTWIYSSQFEFWPPQLHQHLHPHSTCRLAPKSSFALAPISTLLRPALVNGFKQPVQMNDFITFDMLPFIPLHFLCTYFWQLVHCIELLPTPLLQTPHGHLTAFCITFWRSPLIITLALFILTLMPLLSTLSFHSLSLLISLSSVSSVTASSSAYSNSRGRATLNSLDMASVTIINNSGLNAEPWGIPTFTAKPLLLPKLFWQVFLHLCTNCT